MIKLSVFCGLTMQTSEYAYDVHRAGLGKSRKTCMDLQNSKPKSKLNTVSFLRPL
jgi:hypothetical protein